MECELCGIREAVVRAEIEGVVLHVCEKCAKYGKVINTPSPIKKEEKVEKIEFEYVIVDDFYKKIKKEREKREMTQEDLAKAVKEKVSVIKRIEEGWEPPEEVIKKLEKFLEIKLLEKVEVSSKPKVSKEEKLTLGDIVDIKIKKK